MGERLGQSEADPLTGAGDDAAVAAQVEEVAGDVRHREGHGVILQRGQVGGFTPRSLPAGRGRGPTPGAV
jgi:hypothetical protein